MTASKTRPSSSGSLGRPRNGLSFEVLFIVLLSNFYSFGILGRIPSVN
jgi:hypothetical protein